MSRVIVEPLEGRVLLSLAIVADINTRPAPSQEGIAAAGGVAYFAHDDGVHGTEVWKTDGTAAGTALLKDVRPGPAGSEPSHFAAVGSAVFFVVDDGAGNQQLWRTEGTPVSTKLVRQFDAAPDGACLSNLIDVNGVAFFAVDGYARRVLWKSDGTAAGTVPIRSIPHRGPAPQGTSLLYGLSVGGTLYFRGYTNASNDDQELWRSDGTEAGTSLVADLYGSGDVYFPSDFAGLGNQVLFTHQYFSPELWISDGTAGGTRVVKGFGFSVGGLTDLTTFDGRVYFRTRTTGVVAAAEAAVSSPVPPFQSELWSTDGTEAGTERVAVTDYGDFLVGEIEVSGSYLYYTAQDGNELWRVTGPGATPQLVRRGGPSSPSEIHGLVDVAGTLYFFDRETSLQERLYRVTDAVPPQAVALGFAQPPFQAAWSDQVHYNPAAVSGERLFIDTQIRRDLNIHPYDDRELWSIGNGESAMTHVATPKAGTMPSWPHGLSVAGGRVSFDAEERTVSDPADFWTTDGTAAGTRKVAFLGPIHGRQAAALGPVGGVMTFTVYEAGGGYGDPLWRSDGTEAGTFPIVPPSLGTQLEAFSTAAFRGARYFSSPTGGWAIWKTDGTSDGTVPVKQFGSTVPAWFTVAGDTLFFTAGGTLWKCDGTGEGTVPVKAVGDCWGLYAAGEKVIFNVGPYPQPSVLWWSDGTEAGTGPVPSSMVGTYASVGGVTYFSRKSAEGRPQLWRTDGTEATTRLLREFDVVLDQYTSFSISAATAGGALLFAGYDAEHGWELWKSDGTAEGTALLRDVAPGPVSSGFRLFGASDGVVAFAADDLTHGREMWVTDGTPEGTRLLEDLQPGRTASYPTEAIWAGNTLYVSAIAGAVGTEVFTLRPHVVTRQTFYPAPAGAGAAAPALAADKRALLPGEAASFSHVTNAAAGLTGIAVDVESPRGVSTNLSPSDFRFRVRSGAAWRDAPAPQPITVQRGAGAEGSDRVILTWADGAVRNAWLEVTVTAGARTGLDRDDVFYFGNLVGETGARNAADSLTVNALDLAFTRAHFGSIRADALARADFDHNGRVDAKDLAIVRSAISRSLPMLSAVETTPVAPDQTAVVLSGATALTRRTTRRTAFLLDDAGR
jgi:ELWxxDGT repeat protein